jgi:hypothetical protein
MHASFSLHYSPMTCGSTLHVDFSVCLVLNQKVYRMGSSLICMSLVSFRRDGTVHRVGIFPQNEGWIGSLKSAGSIDPTSTYPFASPSPLPIASHRPPQKRIPPQIAPSLPRKPSLLLSPVGGGGSAISPAKLDRQERRPARSSLIAPILLLGARV